MFGRRLGRIGRRWSSLLLHHAALGQRIAVAITVAFRTVIIVVVTEHMIWQQYNRLLILQLIGTGHATLGCAGTVRGTSRGG